MPHPTGVVIGEGARIGRGAVLYQNVTLGRRNADDAAYPALGDDVTLYAGCVLVGGVHVGDGAVVGALCFVATDIPAGAVCYFAGAPVVKPARSE